jgi:hypothetical protein
MTRRLLPILVIATLLLSVSACNVGRGTPTPVPTAVPPTAGSDGYETDSCSNEYLPVVEGATWDYTATGLKPGRFTRSIIHVTPAGFTIQDVFSGTGVTRADEWQCDDGTLMAMQPDEGATASLRFYDRIHDFQTTEVSGVTIPDQLLPTVIWNEGLVLEGTGSLNAHTGPARDTIMLDCTAGNVETVTVAAGVFSAIRGNCRLDEKFTVTVGSVDVPADLVTASTVWYASHVGLVKSEQVVGNGPKTTIELTAYKIP